MEKVLDNAVMSFVLKVKNYLISEQECFIKFLKHELDKTWCYKRLQKLSFSSIHFSSNPWIIIFAINRVFSRF